MQQQQDVASIILMGHQLDGKEAQALEQTLTNAPDNFEDRLQLIGYYYKHYYCCEPAGKRRIDHIVWLIRKHPDYKPILSSYLHTHILDRRGYACIKAAWQAALTRYPQKIDVYSNYAAFVQFQEPELAMELYEKALKIAPSNAGLINRAQKLRSTMDLLVENRNTMTESPGKSYFVPGAVTCNTASRVLTR